MTHAGIVAATYAADDRILSYDVLAITHEPSGARTMLVPVTPRVPSCGKKLRLGGFACRRSSRTSLRRTR